MNTEDLLKIESVESIEALMKEGLSVPSIFRKLGGTDDLARNIASVPSYELRDKYNKLNNILIGVLVYLTTIQILSVILLFNMTEIPKYIFAFGAIIPVIALLTARQIHKFRGQAYRIAILLCGYVCYKTLPVSLESTTLSKQIIALVLLVPLIYGIFLAIYLQWRLCPYLGLWGAKTDEDGNYIFLKAG